MSTPLTDAQPTRYFVTCPAGHYPAFTAAELTGADGTFLCPDCGIRYSLRVEEEAKLRRLNEFQRKEAAR